MRWICATLASAVLAAPSELLGVLPANASKVMTVYVRNSGDGVLEAFRSASLAAALRCQLLREGDDETVQCTPSDAGKGFQGYAVAVEVKKHHAVAISAYSSNVFNPHGELFPAVELALENFRRAIANDPNVLRLEECAAPHYDACVLPP